MAATAVAVHGRKEKITAAYCKTGALGMERMWCCLEKTLTGVEIDLVRLGRGADLDVTVPEGFLSVGERKGSRTRALGGGGIAGVGLERVETKIIFTKKNEREISLRLKARILQGATDALRRRA